MAWSRLCGMFTLLIAAALLAPSFAQDKKDDKAKEVKKDDAKGDDKKDPPKKDEEKSSSKKSAKDDAKPPEEKVEYGQTMTAKIKQMDPDSPKDIILEVQVPDPQKILQFNQWKQQQLVQIAQAQPQQRAQRLQQYQLELVKRQLDLGKPADYPIRAAENMKVRTQSPPIEYDDKGNLKRWTAKQLTALKGNSKLPGYPADFDALKAGQVVTVYFAKQAGPAPKTKAKKSDDDDLGAARPEAVMILVVLEARSP